MSRAGARVGAGSGGGWSPPEGKRGWGSRVCSQAGGRQRAGLPGLPQSLQSLPVPLALSPCAPTLAPLGGCAAAAYPQDPLLHQRQVSLSWTASALTPKPVHCASASVAAPTPSPFPGCAVLGPQEEAARGSATGTHPGPRRRPLHKFLLGSETPGPAGSTTADCSPPAAGGGEGSTGPGKDHARTRGVGVRQGGTALNALDSPASTLLPPSSTDSWGLCFLHPPGGSRSAPTAARDSPSAVAAARLVHPREPGQSHHPFPGVRGGDPSRREVQVAPR